MNDSSSGEDAFEDEPEPFNLYAIDRNPLAEEYVLVEFKRKQAVYYYMWER